MTRAPSACACPATRAVPSPSSISSTTLSWKPGYRASLDSGASTIELARLATVAQNTGEDWSNVKLTLSTSQPRQSPVGREAQPWLLSWTRPAPQDFAPAQYAAPPRRACLGAGRGDGQPQQGPARRYRQQHAG
ncbi:DUF4139 domain-containing protein [Massilia sp. B-10]|nr:DUF4139 domain-containing protein [Massilia sp. B-10]